MSVFESRLDEVVRSTMFHKDIPGVAITINRNEQMIYAKGFGVTNIETKQLVTPKTLFHMASITKTFVAVAAAQLIEKNRMGLGNLVIEYLPYFKLKDERYQRITIQQLLNHTSGIPDCEDYEWEHPEYDEGALERYVKEIRNISLLSEPGEKFKYSNIAYEILGDIISKVSGMSIEDYVYYHILRPLKMKDSTMLLQNTKYEALARPHVKDQNKNVVISKVFPYNRKHGPSSTMYSNVIDISRWAMVSLNKGILEGERIVDTLTYDLMWAPSANIPGEEQKIGLGWFLGNYKGMKVVGHEGCDIGFRSSFCILPEENLGITVLANSDYASTKRIMQHAIEWVLD